MRQQSFPWLSFWLGYRFQCSCVFSSLFTFCLTGLAVRGVFVPRLSINLCNPLFCDAKWSPSSEYDWVVTVEIFDLLSLTTVFVLISLAISSYCSRDKSPWNLFKWGSSNRVFPHNFLHVSFFLYLMWSRMPVLTPGIRGNGHDLFLKELGGFF